MRDDLRRQLMGFSEDNDRLWLLHTHLGVFPITEYNKELTGYHYSLGALDPQVFRYGGNAYYILGKYAQERGWIIESVEDRQFSRTAQ